MRHQNLDLTGLHVKPGLISTFSGGYLDINDPDPEMFLIKDIAHQLSMQPRFGGKLRRFYSVAQHSVGCALDVPMEHKLAALLHDASEAYICDIPSPVKAYLPDYKIIEDRIMRAIAIKFGFQYPLSKEVKDADEYMLQYEWSSMVRHKTAYPEFMSQEKAEDTFIGLFNVLTCESAPRVF